MMARIYIDSNVFLDFYQSATDRMSVFQEIAKRRECILVPEQTIREVRRNRALRLNWLALQIEKNFKSNIHTTSLVREMPEFKAWQTARDAAGKELQKIALQLKAWAKDESSDPVYQEFVKVYAYGTTMSTPRDAIAKAQTRKLIGDPPTSPDKHSLGDEIIWETLLACCEDDLVIVSRDHTFLDNEGILRFEFENTTKKRLLAITPSLSNALELIGSPSEAIADAERQNQDDGDVQAIASGKCPTCNVELREDGYEGSDGDEAWWMNCPKCHRDYFPSY